MSKHLDGYETIEIIDRPLTPEEQRAFAILDSPAGEAWAWEVAQVGNSDSLFATAGLGKEWERTWQTAGLQLERLKLVEEFYDRMTQYKRLAPREMARRIITQRFTVDFAADESLPFEHRQELCALAEELSEAYE